GKKYLDFITGIACVPLGHGNKYVANAISRQAEKLVQVSNLYYTEPQVVLAEKLAKLSGLEKCFFGNSGAEANEAAIKLAKKVTGKKKFIAFEHGFHGRIGGSLAATWKEKYRLPFMPLSPDVTFVKYNDFADLEKAATGEIAAIIIEPIQGEAGIIIPDKGYMKKVEKLCREKSILLIADEVQAGNGKTGKFFAYLHEGIKPDIVTTAKGIANGVPIGVCISRAGLDFEKGNHGSTFGGNCLACAAANATIDYILKKHLMENAVEMGNYFVKKLEGLMKKKGSITAIRGKGLMIGIDIKADAKQVANDCIKKGLLVNNAADHTLRLLPPMVINKKHVDEAISILESVL
ncbi:MAG: acetylornithine/succinylornithine family transaminase, partial [Candidatus Thermoplasmatota archaeon]|nr:acetylornithine/succinylornithine family transaminase [Candidatus Thermoplasmatota archaeon]